MLFNSLPDHYSLTIFIQHCMIRLWEVYINKIKLYIVRSVTGQIFNTLRRLIRKGSVSVKVVAVIFYSVRSGCFAVCAVWVKELLILIGFAKVAETNSNIDRFR